MCQNLHVFCNMRLKCPNNSKTALLTVTGSARSLFRFPARMVPPSAKPTLELVSCSLCRSSWGKDAHGVVFHGRRYSYVDLSIYTQVSSFVCMHTPVQCLHAIFQACMRVHLPLLVAGGGLRACFNFRTLLGFAFKSMPVLVPALRGPEPLALKSRSLPGESVACNHGQLSINFGRYFGVLGFRVGPLSSETLSTERTSGSPARCSFSASRPCRPCRNTPKAASQDRRSEACVLWEPGRVRTVRMVPCIARRPNSILVILALHLQRMSRANGFTSTKTRMRA